MNLTELIRWQYRGYAIFHRSRENLLMHIVCVPLFIAGNIGLIVTVANLMWLGSIAAIAVMIVSVALQGRGHARERHPAEPFTGAINAIARIFLEQWITFPRFVLSGGWRRALSQSNESGIAEPTNQ